MFKAVCNFCKDIIQLTLSNCYDSFPLEFQDKPVEERERRCKTKVYISSPSDTLVTIYIYYFI